MKTIYKTSASRVSKLLHCTSGMRLAVVLLVIAMIALPAMAGGRSSRSGSHSYHARSSGTRTYGYHARSSSVASTRHRSSTRSYRSASPHRSSGHTSRTRNTSSSYHYASQRTSHGRIKRSEAAKDAFKRQHPCPSTGKSRGACPGYVIDHVRPLASGGPDSPTNMQWQTTADAKAKDKWERKR